MIKNPISLSIKKRLDCLFINNNFLNNFNFNIHYNHKNKTIPNNSLSFNKNFLEYRGFQKYAKKCFFKKTKILLRNRNYNFYEVLGVERNSTNEQIKQAYLKLARQYHPDVNKDPGADDRYKNLSLAYEALSNQRNRDLYDAYMENDPYMNDFNFWKEDEDFVNEENSRSFHERKAGSSSKNSNENNFRREEYEDRFYKNYDDIFNSGFKESKPIKGDDINVN